MQPRSDQRSPGLSIPYWELVALVALLMALSALSIDIMLPALPQIGDYFSVADPNQRQGVVTSYLLGLAAGQLLYGPLSDRYGRKRLLLLGLLVYLAGAVAALLVTGFSGLFAARIVQGMGGAAARVISVAVVRDLFSGRQMARVMSISMTVFIIVPVLAPAVGQALTALGNWRWTFLFLVAIGLLAMAWSMTRLPETQRAHAKGRAPVRPRTAAWTVLTTRQTAAYTIASGFMFGCLASYIGSAQQVFVDVFNLGSLFPLAFGVVASAMAVAAFTNARLVQRLGMRRMSHMALIGFLVISAAMVGASLFSQPHVLTFAALLTASFFMFGLIMPNFGAIAMQPLGEIAGMGSSLTGFYSTAAGAVFGWLVGQAFDGTVRPLAIGFFLLGCLTLVAVLAAEGRRGLFEGE